jgi:hypothetical protein
VAKITFHEPVEILGYGPWDANNERMGEFVRIKFEGDSESRRYTVDKAVNGSRPNPGETVNIEAESIQRHKAVIGRDSKPYVVTREQIRVVAFLKAA